MGDFSFWHETVMAVLSPQIRYWEVNGPSSVAVRGPSLTHNRPSVIDLSKVTIVPSPHIGG
jgi:hypothetical protein